MTRPLAGWLQVREQADAVARSAPVAGALVRRLGDHDPLCVLDLGTGTGSNIRHLLPTLPARQDWLVIDRDADLLALLPDRVSSWAVTRGWRSESRPNGCRLSGGHVLAEIATRSADLDDLTPQASLFEGRHLVTASALLDLASASWLATIARQCRRVGAAALFALTYNGWSACTPEEVEDEMVRDSLNRHQLRDKGLGGPAAGPGAAALAAQAFEDVEYAVVSERSDWNLGPKDNDLQRALVDGWGEAAIAIRPDAVELIARWRARRHAHIEAHRSRIAVGHVDLAAWPRP